MLCHQTQADTDICGDKRVKFKLCVHIYCQIQTGHKAPALTHTGLLCSFQSCFICCKMGASITCCGTGCDRTFHLPCAPHGQCVTQYFGAYRSFCWEHRPHQALQPRPSQDNTCSICLDTVENKISYKTMGCPACQDARFHRHCIQRLALHSGIGFRCPCCLNQDPFTMEMLIVGIRLPKRLGFLLASHKALRCRTKITGSAIPCYVPLFSQPPCSSRPWQLWLCSSCTAEGTHQLCSSLGDSTCSWECSTCAATDTGRHQSAQCCAVQTGAGMDLTAGPAAHGLAPRGLWIAQWPLQPAAWGLS
uniref:RING-type domain-containing protein n=1 Tax=Taeniopygia guttata TaxID=59729 RepID=H0ZMF8_TAEGU